VRDVHAVVLDLVSAGDGPVDDLAADEDSVVEVAVLAVVADGTLVGVFELARGLNDLGGAANTRDDGDIFVDDTEGTADGGGEAGLVLAVVTTDVVASNLVVVWALEVHVNGDPRVFGTSGVFGHRVSVRPEELAAVAEVDAGGTVVNERLASIDDVDLFATEGGVGLVVSLTLMWRHFWVATLPWRSLPV